MSTTVQPNNIESKPVKKRVPLGIWFLLGLVLIGFFSSMNQPQKTDKELIIDCAKQCTVEQFVQMKKEIETKEKDSEKNSELMKRILEEAQKPSAENQEKK